MNTPGGIGRPFLLILLLFSLLLVGFLLKPFLHPIVLAAVLAALFHPLQKRLVLLCRGKKTVAALLSTGCVTFCITVPGLLLLTALASQGVVVLEKARVWIDTNGPQKLLEHPAVADALTRLQHLVGSPGLDPAKLMADIQNLALNASRFLLSHGAGFLSNLTGLLFHFGILLFLLFFLLRDGKDMLSHLKSFSPLGSHQEDRILQRIRDVARSVLLGSFLTALCQGLAGGVGLALCGIPGLFWGTVMAFASLVPVIGTALIWLPAVGWLVLMGSWKAAIFLAAWSILVVGSIDSFLRPFLMGGKSGLSPFSVFLAVLGGVQLFGLAGLLYGPLIIGFAAVMLAIYEEEYHPKQTA